MSSDLFIGFMTYLPGTSQENKISAKPLFHCEYLGGLSYFILHEKKGCQEDHSFVVSLNMTYHSF